MPAISIAYSLFVFVVLLASQELFRRYPKLMLAFFVVIPILLLPYWTSSGVVEGWFPWVKGFSILIGIILLSLFNLRGFENKKFDRWFVCAFLAVNISEAIIKDLATGNIPNYLNALAGTLLILTLSKLNTIHIDTHKLNLNGTKKFKDLHWDGMTIPWIIGYTIWNGAFVYLNFTQSSLHHLAVLAAALVIGILNKGRWFQARVVTLGTYIILSALLPHIDTWYSGNFNLYMSIISLGFMSIYAIMFIRSHKYS